jgi:hypothetical protein
VVGYFATEFEAAQRYDVRASELKRPINVYDEEHSAKKDCIVVGPSAGYTKGPYLKKGPSKKALKVAKKDDQKAKKTKYSHQLMATRMDMDSQLNGYQQFNNNGDGFNGHHSYSNVAAYPNYLSTKTREQGVQTMPAFTMLTVSKRKSPDELPSSQQNSTTMPVSTQCVTSLPPHPSPIMIQQQEQVNHSNSSFLMSLAETALSNEAQFQHLRPVVPSPPPPLQGRAAPKIMYV